MKTFAPSLRGAATLALVAGLAILFGGACAGNGGGGSPAGGSGGSPTGGSSTGGSGNGGSGTGGAAGAPGSGGRATGGAVGTGGAASGGAVGTGGGPGSGGSGQGGAAGSGGGSGHCGARAGLLFCDDFESDAAGVPPATPWATSIIGAGTVTIDGSDPAASGTKSVHIQDGDSDYDTLLALHDTTILPSPTGRLYVRFYIRLAAAMTAGHNSFVLGDLFASPGDAGSLRFSEDNQMFAESIGGDAQGAMSNNNFYNDHQIGPGLTAGQWACVELLLDHVTPEIDVWLNGTEIPDLKSTAWALDAYDDLRFGFEKYAGPGSEIWYDDIALGTQPIGCD